MQASRRVQSGQLVRRLWRNASNAELFQTSSMLLPCKGTAKRFFWSKLQGIICMSALM